MYLLALAEVHDAEEDLLLLLEVLVDATFLDKRVNGLGIFLLDDLTMLAVLLDVEDHDDVVGSWILDNVLQVVFGGELDDIVT